MVDQGLRVTMALPNRILNCKFFGDQPAVLVKSKLQNSRISPTLVNTRQNNELAALPMNKKAQGKF